MCSSTHEAAAETETEAQGQAATTPAEAREADDGVEEETRPAGTRPTGTRPTGRSEAVTSRAGEDDSAPGKPADRHDLTGGASHRQEAHEDEPRARKEQGSSDGDRGRSHKRHRRSHREDDALLDEGSVLSNREAPPSARRNSLEGPSSERGGTKSERSVITPPALAKKPSPISETVAKQASFDTSGVRQLA